jgi:undecaprenyl-diphosphatase
MNGRPKGWLSSPNLLAKNPRIGWILFFIGVIVFALLAINYKANGPLLNMDTTVSNALHTTALNASKGLLAFLNGGWFLGNEVAIVLSLLMGIYFLIRRYWQEFWMDLAGNVGAPLLFIITSHIFNRHRPVFAVPVENTLNGPGFPSGHCVIAVTCYGLLAYLLLPRISSRFGKFMVIVITLIIILFIGFSRVFVGGHYPTDAVAGFALGFAWAGIAYMTIESYFARRNKHKIENEKAG